MGPRRVAMARCVLQANSAFEMELEVRRQEVSAEFEGCGVLVFRACRSVARERHPGIRGRWRTTILSGVVDRLVQCAGYQIPLAEGLWVVSVRVL